MPTSPVSSSAGHPSAGYVCGPLDRGPQDLATDLVMMGESTSRGCALIAQSPLREFGLKAGEFEAMREAIAVGRQLRVVMFEQV